MTIRKATKANWHYDCGPCGLTSGPSTDLYGAQLIQADHERSTGHTAALVGEAMSQVAQRFMEAVLPLVDAFNSIPHDPAVRRNRRAW